MRPWFPSSSRRIHLKSGRCAEKRRSGFPEASASASPRTFTPARPISTYFSIRSARCWAETASASLHFFINLHQLPQIRDILRAATGKRRTDRTGGHAQHLHRFLHDRDFVAAHALPERVERMNIAVHEAIERIEVAFHARLGQLQREL